MLAIAGLALSVGAQAQPADCTKPVFNNAATQFFPDSIVRAKEAYELICSGDPAQDISAERLNEVFTKFHVQLAKDAKVQIPSIAPYLDIYHDPLLVLAGDGFAGMQPSHIEDASTNFLTIEKLVLYKQGKGSRVSQEIPKYIAQACFSDESCWSGFSGYMDILKTVYLPLGLKNIAQADQLISIKDDEWNRYIEKSRSQTLFDIAVTTFAYEITYGKQPDVFSSPPKVQWFFMHPSVTIENVKGALDGDESKEALALELLGFNYWKDACFGYACGASLIVNYADRNGIEDRGWGAMFHIDNSYSFGVTKHGSETGIFITVDLLKLFQDKKSSFAQYKEKFRTLGR